MPQINFYILPDELEQLERVIASVEPVAILTERSPTRRPRIVQSLREVEGDRTLLFYYLARRSDVAKIETEHIDNLGHWVIDALAAPVIEVTTCAKDGILLRRGRIYYPSLRFASGARSPEFLMWSRRIFAKVRKHLTRHAEGYLSSGAVEFTRKGGKLIAI